MFSSFTDYEEALGEMIFLWSQSAFVLLCGLVTWSNRQSHHKLLIRPSVEETSHLRRE